MHFLKATLRLCSAETQNTCHGKYDATPTVSHFVESAPLVDQQPTAPLVHRVLLVEEADLVHAAQEVPIRGVLERRSFGMFNAKPVRNVEAKEEKGEKCELHTAQEMNSLLSMFNNLSYLS